MITFLGARWGLGNPERKSLFNPERPIFKNEEHEIAKGLFSKQSNSAISASRMPQLRKSPNIEFNSDEQKLLKSCDFEKYGFWDDGHFYVHKVNLMGDGCLIDGQTALGYISGLVEKNDNMKAIILAGADKEGNPLMKSCTYNTKTNECIVRSSDGCVDTNESTVINNQKEFKSKILDEMKSFNRLIGATLYKQQD